MKILLTQHARRRFKARFYELAAASSNLGRTMYWILNAATVRKRDGLWVAENGPFEGRLKRIKPGVFILCTVTRVYQK